MRLLIARHAETTWNIEKRIQGWSDSKLTSHGTAQAKALADRLRNHKIDAIYCSDASRAVRTAECVSLWHDIEVEPMMGLRETSWGEWEGMTGEEIAVRYLDVWPKFVARGQASVEEDEADWDTTTLVPGGETMNDASSRISAAVQQIRTKHANSQNCVLVVGHGGSLRFLFTTALGLRPGMARRFHLDNTSLSEIWYSRNQPPVIHLLNDISHLTTLPAP